MNDAVRCRGCGASMGGDVPEPDHCGKCPPWVCNQCGEMDSATKHCRCWQSLEGMALADIKAVFAASDMSLGGLNDGGGA